MMPRTHDQSTSSYRKTYTIHLFVTWTVQGDSFTLLVRWARPGPSLALLGLNLLSVPATNHTIPHNLLLINEPA